MPEPVSEHGAPVTVGGGAKELLLPEHELVHLVEKAVQTHVRVLGQTAPELLFHAVHELGEDVVDGVIVGVESHPVDVCPPGDVRYCDFLEVLLLGQIQKGAADEGLVLLEPPIGGRAVHFSPSLVITFF